MFLREPIEDLKYLNIDYTQFNGWSSDEEVIYVDLIIITTIIIITMMTIIIAI